MYVDIDLDNLNFEKEFIPDNVSGISYFLWNMCSNEWFSLIWNRGSVLYRTLRINNTTS